MSINDPANGVPLTVTTYSSIPLPHFTDLAHFLC